MATMGYAWNHLYALQMPGRVTVLTSVSLLVALPIFYLFIHTSGPATGPIILAAASANGALEAAMSAAGAIPNMTMLAAM